MNKLKRNIHKLCQTTMAALMNFILLYTNPYNPNSDRNFTFASKPFQILGLDILVDENLKPWLLEINDTPSMNSFLCKQEMACNHKDCPISPVDQYVKKRVLFDTVDLMLNAREMGGAHLLGSQFRSLTRVHPSQDSTDKEIYDKIRDLRYLFLAVTKGKFEMTSNEFLKVFCRSKFLSQHCGIKKADLTILFQKGSKNERTIGFFGFFGLL